MPQRCDKHGYWRGPKEVIKDLWKEANIKWKELREKEFSAKAICIWCSAKTRYTAKPFRPAYNIYEANASDTPEVQVCEYCFITYYCAWYLCKFHYFLKKWKLARIKQRRLLKITVWF